VNTINSILCEQYFSTCAVSIFTTGFESLIVAVFYHTVRAFLCARHRLSLSSFDV